MARTVALSNRALADTVPGVSVVVPSYQSSSYIRSVLEALLNQETTVSYEIVVVDSSTDGTDLIIERQFPQVRLLHFPHRCQVGRARNLGASAARGAVVLFTDTDTIPCSTWVEQMARAIRALGADGVGGAMANGTPWSITGCAGFYLEFFRFVPHCGDPQEARYLVGGNSGFRREILSAMHYEERSPGEDMLFSSQLASHGGKLLFLPGASVVHRNRTGFMKLLRYQSYLGGGAYGYRSADASQTLKLLQAVPALIFLAPFAVMFWIAWSLLRRSAIADLLRFVAVLPLCWLASMSWAFGFYKALLEGKDRKSQ